ncbi:E3 SUMO-protein ligase pli1 [Clarireedia jacksonii]
MAQNRHTIVIPLKPQNYPILARISSDPTLRVKVFCAGEVNGKQDIAFPHQSEIKVNQGDVKANLRGLKNKPGSTLPVDITNDLRLKLAGYQNNVEMTYALTTKKFYLVIYVVKTVSVSELVKKLASGKRITKDSVVNEMITKARGADIVATASVLSLKCPISTLRIELPCRSVSCRHNQCFDATSYLQLQEQAPTWTCPICTNPAPFENLAVDEYVKDILQNTSRSVDQVTVEPEGKWTLYSKPDPTSTRNGVASDSEDDDIIVITQTNNKIHMSTPTKPPPPANGTLTPATREPSTSSAYSSRPNGSSISSKRPLPEVIDLTSSGDEDDAPPVERQPKRQMTGSYAPLLPPPPYTTNGYR